MPKNHETITDNSFWTEYFMQPNTYFEQEQIIWFLKILPLVEQKRSKAKKYVMPVTFLRCVEKTLWSEISHANDGFNRKES